MIGWEAVDGRVLVLFAVLLLYAVWVFIRFQEASEDLHRHGLDQESLAAAARERARIESAEWDRLVGEVSSGRRDFAADVPQPFDVESADPRTWDVAVDQSMRVAQAGERPSLGCACPACERAGALPHRRRLSAPATGVVRWRECPGCDAPVVPGSWACGECGTNLDDDAVGGGR